MFHRDGVHPADGEIQVDPAEDLEARRLFAREKRQPGGRIVVILEDDSAHALRARQLRRFEPVVDARHVVGI